MMDTAGPGMKKYTGARRLGKEQLTRPLAGTADRGSASRESRNDAPASCHRPHPSGNAGHG